MANLAFLYRSSNLRNSGTLFYNAMIKYYGFSEKVLLVDQRAECIKAVAHKYQISAVFWFDFSIDISGSIFARVWPKSIAPAVLYFANVYTKSWQDAAKLDNLISLVHIYSVVGISHK